MKAEKPVLALAVLVFGSLFLMPLLRSSRPVTDLVYVVPAEPAGNGWQTLEEARRQRLRAEAAAAQARLEQEHRAEQRERRLLTPECRFWWQQHELRPTSRSSEKKQQFCDT